MSELNSTQGVPQQVPPIAGPSVDQATNITPVGPSGSIGTLEDLKAKCPPLYDAITMAIAMAIKKDQERSNAEMKRILREDAERRR